MRRRSKPRIRPVKVNCPFCKERVEPSWKKPEILGQYLTDRGRIIGKVKTGLCAKHQRRVAREVKRARHLALLPFVIRI